MSHADRAPELAVALAQVAPISGDIEANAHRAAAEIRAAAASGARLVLFGELPLVGYDVAALTESGPSARVRAS